MGELQAYVEATSYRQFRSRQVMQKVSDEVSQKHELMELDASTRSVIETVMLKAGLSFLEFPDIKTLLDPESSLPLQVVVAQREAMIRSIPSIAPADGWLASGFGVRIDPWNKTRGEHKGLDISNIEGTVVRAPADGYIRYAARYGRFGNYISIVHGYGVVTKYAHLKETRVKAGQAVKRGDIIALMGSTGKSTGTHLHYEVWINDKPFNPYAFMPKIMQQNAKISLESHRVDNLPNRQIIEVASMH